MINRLCRPLSDTAAGGDGGGGINNEKLEKFAKSSACLSCPALVLSWKIDHYLNKKKRKSAVQYNNLRHSTDIASLVFLPGFFWDSS